jgi:hypothetical protein
MSAMPRWIKISAEVAGAAAAIAAATAAVGTLLWNRTTARSVKRLISRSLAQAANRDKDGRSFFSREHLALLPAPVTRYFEFALREGQPLIRTATLRQTGVLRTAADAAWSPFSAVEHFSVRPPGFVWGACCRMPPFVPMRIRDSYISCAGASEAKLAGVIPVGGQRGTPELASASLVRYLAEAAWVPTASLPGEGVTWAEVDHQNAPATLTDMQTTVSIDVHFGQDGGIERVSTMRYRDVSGDLVLTPWGGYFREYAPMGEMMIPMATEVQWGLPEGALSVWHGRIVTLNINLRCSPQIVREWRTILHIGPGRFAPLTWHVHQQPQGSQVANCTGEAESAPTCHSGPHYAAACMTTRSRAKAVRETLPTQSGIQWLPRARIELQISRLKFVFRAARRNHGATC